MLMDVIVFLGTAVVSVFILSLVLFLCIKQRNGGIVTKSNPAYSRHSTTTSGSTISTSETQLSPRQHGFIETSPMQSPQRITTTDDEYDYIVCTPDPHVSSSKPVAMEDVYYSLPTTNHIAICETQQHGNATSSVRKATTSQMEGRSVDFDILYQWMTEIKDDKTHQ